MAISLFLSVRTRLRSLMFCLRLRSSCALLGDFLRLVIPCFAVLPFPILRGYYTRSC